MTQGDSGTLLQPQTVWSAGLCGVSWSAGLCGVKSWIVFQSFEFCNPHLCDNDCTVQLLISLTVVLILYPVYYLFDPYNIMESSMLECANHDCSGLASQPGLTDIGQTSELPQSDAELSHTQVRHNICIPKHSNSIQGLKIQFHPVLVQI